VSIPAAGMLVSGYALGVTVGAPILAVVTAKMPRKKALMSLIGVFIVGNLLCAIAPGYWILMGARIVTAFCHGAFFGIGSVVAADLVAPNRRAQAIALMFTGLTLANVLGVPLGTALGQAAGWRATFWVVTLIGLAAAGALALCLPKHIEMRDTSILREFNVLKNPQVLMVLGISVLASASLFSVFTYITPMLLANNATARILYDRAMHEAWQAKNELLDRGVPPEIALYVLPNAKSIRLVESGSLLHLLHKWTMRTCFNAQEEIYQASRDEVAQLAEVHPQFARYIGPPCHLRAGVTTPICTEGSHFCGVKVWLDFPNITRRI